jgi:chromate transporter
MATPVAAALFWHFLLLCSIAVGGTSTVMPDMYRFVVEQHGWLSASEFAELYTLAQVSPGPNALWVTLIGLQAGGWLGALATTLALLIPSVAFSLGAVALHARNPESRLGLAIRSGLAPLALGFMFAGAWLLLRSVGQEWQGYALTAATLVVVLRTRLNPLWMIGAGALAGVLGFV